MTVKAILEAKGHDVLTLGPNEKLSEAIKLLAGRNAVLVDESGEARGILTRIDLIEYVAV